MIYWDGDGLVLRGEDGQTTGWRIVALDPYGLRYFDEDAAAMDETNWDAMVASFDDETSLETIDGIDAFRGWYRPDVRAEADWGVLPFETLRADDNEHDGAPSWTGGRGSWRDRAWWKIGMAPQEIGSGVDSVVCVVREDSDAWDVWQDIAKSLSNYPLLNEDAYFERECAAWVDWWGSDGIGDLLRSDVDEIVGRLEKRGVPVDVWGDDGDMDLGEYVEYEADHTTLAYVADHAMAYQNGFTGEYDAAGAIDGITRHLAGGWWLVTWLVRNGGRINERAHGVQTLPGIGWAP